MGVDVIPVELLAVGGLLVLVGLVAAVRSTAHGSSEPPTPSTERVTGTTGSVERPAEPSTDDPADETTGDDPSVVASELDPVHGEPDESDEDEESEESGNLAGQTAPDDSDDETAPDAAAADRRVLGLIGAAANASTRAEAALDNGDYDLAETRLQSAQSTLETAIKIDDTYDLDRAADLEARRTTVEETLEDVERQRDADKRVIGMFGSAASSVSYAETAIEDGDDELAATRLRSALSTYETAANLDETHALGRGDDIERRRAEVEDLLAEIERRRDGGSTTGGDAAADRTSGDRALTDVSGVLSADAAALRAAGFESVADLERASTEELQAVDGIDPHVALRIKADVGG